MLDFKGGSYAGNLEVVPTLVNLSIFHFILKKEKARRQKTGDL